MIDRPNYSSRTVAPWSAIGCATLIFLTNCASNTDAGGRPGSNAQNPATASGGGTPLAGSGAVGPTAAGGAGTAAGAGVGAGATTSVGGAAGVAGTTAASGTGGAAAGSPAVATDCTGDTGGLLAPKRVVRLTLDQVNYSIRDFVAPAVSDQLAEDYELNDPILRQFPAHLGEGHVVSEATWSKTDGMAQIAGQYVHDNFAAATGCAAGDTACATTFITSFFAKTARRPLTAEEDARMQQVATEVQSYGGTAEQVAQYGVYAALSSPQFLYRSELGTDPAAEEMLTPYELASMLSYFIMGAPPDDALLAEAAAGTLNSPDALRAQADRLLATPQAREYLQTLMLASFGIPNVYSVVLTDPAATQAAKNSMVLGARLFINDILWSGAPVNDLLTSQTGYVNETIAPFYGVSPPAMVDADGFGPVQLPADRAGLLTNVGYLTSTARPDFPSVVGRGVKTVDDILCVYRAPFPENLGDAVSQFNMDQAGNSEREKAEARASDPICAGCHTNTDPYGLALFSYDEIGRYRTSDPEGRPIDTTVTLPASIGGATVTTAAEMARVIADSNSFVGCVAGNLMEDAIGEGTVLTTDCAAQAVLNELQARGSQTFSDLVREVSASRTMTTRRGGI